MKDEIVLYKPNEQFQLEVRIQDETVWLTQQQMVALFDTAKSNISMHISNIFKEGELQKSATVQDFLTVQNEGGRQVSRRVQYYNLDVIISVGYRVKSKRGTQVRQWANQVLKDYLLRGYAINQRLVAVENRIDRKLQEHTDQIKDLQDKVDFFVRTNVPPVNTHKWSTPSHDRWLIIDDYLYHCGHSLKDMGKKLSAITLMGTSPEMILKEVK